MTNSKPQTSAEITDEMVAEWKRTYTNVYEIKVPVDDDESGNMATYYAKPPSVSQMNVITEIASDKKRGGELPAMKTLKAQLILGGDMEYLADDYRDASIYLAVMEKLGELVNQKKARSRKV